MKREHKKRLIIGLILIGIIAFLYYLDVGHYITLESVKANRQWLQDIIANNYWRFVAGYFGVYIAAAAFSLPVAAVFSLAGGFFFGTVRGALFSTMCATVGSTISFLLIRYSFGKVLQDRYKEQLRAFNKEIKQYGYSYLLGLHFFIVLPLFLSNVLAGLANIPLWTFMWTTSVGLIPGTFVFAFAGQQLMTIESTREIFSLNIILAILFLLLLSLIPFFVRWLRSFKKTHQTSRSR